MLKFIDGFDQYQGQTSGRLLASLAAAAYTTTTGIAMVAGRRAGMHALELQVAAGASGESWTIRTNGNRQDLKAVTNNGTGRWIAVGDAGSAIGSNDGISWSPLITGSSRALNGIDCDAGRWIAVGDNGTILVSIDGGISWEPRVCPLPAANLKAIKFADHKWVAVGENGAAGAIIISTDNGATWSFIPDNPGPAGNACIGYGNGVWMVGGVNGQLRTSTDALTWTTRASGIATTITALATNNLGTWIALSGRTIRYTLNDGTSWLTSTTTIGGTNTSLIAAAFSGGRWVVAGATSFMATSDDILTWEIRALTGSAGAGNYITAIDTSKGSDGALIAVGTRNGTAATATSLIFMSSAPPTTVKRTFNSTSNRVVLGFAHKANARGRILNIEGVLQMDWPGAVQILGSNSTAVPIRNAWYYYELVIDKTAQTVQLFVNDTADITVPLPSAALAVVDYAVTWITENGAVTQLDDVYFLDGDASGGSTLTNRLRPITIPLRLPDSDVDIAWAGSAEQPHWSLVGVLPPSESSYVQSAESGAKDVYASSASLPSGSGAVLAVGVVALAQKSDLDNRHLGLVVGTGSTQLEVIDTTLSIDPEYSFAIFEKAPGNVAWDATNVLTTPFGVVVRP